MNRDGSHLGFPIRVLLVVRWPVGGIRTFLRYVLNSLPNERFEFTVIGVDTDGMKALRSELAHRLKDSRAVAADGKEERSLLSEVVSCLKAKEFDVIHAHGFTSATVAVLPSLIFRVPLLCTSHDVINENQFLTFNGWIKKRVLYLSLKMSRLVHSVSNDAEKNLLDFFPEFPRNRSVVIPNGIDTNHFFNAQAHDVHALIGVDPSTPIIGFFGRFMGQKGFRDLISAAERIRNEKLLPNFQVACFGSGAFIREEKADIERRGLSSFFSFIPFTPDVSGMMKGCNVIAMPSYWEACPLQPMEALSAGVPFVGTNCLGLREVLHDTPAYVVEVGSPHDLANAIVRAIEEGNASFVNYAPYAAKRFDINKTISQIAALYESVV
ncbi:glycosyltransferase family 1 protein [Marinobacter halodurans]|uniref:Glycosyltransferase family 1 protein n=1 Tax=Marinobacter halodurans TaxID=2528979 RepID=A0ABY1ZJB3_9GAMM|nr:glycosyltransferase family 4 protein [Marinobacter halodurans]TBW51585.1 glycosyltransferase family 1 protein [Marinobacter halodurans]